jgi:hypothetical protein
MTDRQRQPSTLRQISTTTGAVASVNSKSSSPAARACVEWLARIFTANPLLA